MTKQRKAENDGNERCKFSTNKKFHFLKTMLSTHTKGEEAQCSMHLHMTWPQNAS